MYTRHSTTKKKSAGASGAKMPANNGQALCGNLGPGGGGGSAGAVGVGI